MKRHIAILIILIAAMFTGPFAHAQNMLLRTADKLYDQKAYAEAIPYYVDALKKDSSILYALKNLADCHRMINETGKSVDYYAKIVREPEVSPLHIYYYAHALLQTGELQEAQKYFSHYREDERGKIFYDAITKWSGFYRDTAYYRIHPVSFNSPQSDYSPVIVDGNRVIFVSSRYRTQIISYTHSWTGRRYCAYYETQQLENGDYSPARPYAKNMHNRFNAGPLCFDKKAQTVYFTRNNVRDGKAVRNSKGVVTLNLFRAELDPLTNSFQHERDLLCNSDEFNTMHPALSPDGTRLYFASDMDGTAGGMDLWLCSRQGQEWSTPVNLGPALNTAGNEVFPYMPDDSTLYFSSDGYEGMGGLDIYKVRINQDGMPAGVPENTGAPMNSTSDDFGIVFFSDGRTGLLSSNRYSEGRNDNIYAFSIHKPQKQIFSLLVKDSATSAMLSAVLTLEDTAGAQNDQYISLSGTFSLPLFAGEDYVFHVNSEGYKPASGIRLTAPINPDEQMEIRLVQNDFFIEGTIYFQADDGTIAPLDSAIVIITNISGDTVCSNFYFTDVHGKYESCLLKPGGQYFVTAYREGYFTKSTFTVDLSPGGNVQDIYTNRIVIGKAITINNVYFDLDKWNIRPDAAVGLDYVVTLLSENPDIIIELSSHTDCRADDDYNMALSDRRAKACADYIVGRGVVRERITGRGYGESRLLNHCNCDGRRKSDCTEEDHALNRRTEFKVTGFLKSGREVELESNL